MQPRYIPLDTLFSPQIRHTVPLFQRPYVWKRESEWEPLWDDLRATAERVLSAEQGRPASAHFLGTVVLEQVPHASGSLPRREVIDGQQRLTTLQLILKAAEQALYRLQDGAADEHAVKDIAIAIRQIAPLISNPGYAEDEERYKVWPTNEDRAAFRSVMDADSAKAPAKGGSRMAEAAHFFYEAVVGWLQQDHPGKRARALAASLKDHMKMIVLDLDSSDEPQAIFETLNAHGTPLLPADLIKNWLLWEGARQGLAIDQLYRKYWQPFDREDDYWRERVGTGHAARARIDTFLQNWLTRHVHEAISPKHLYNRFLRFVENKKAQNDSRLDVSTLMADIAADAERFRKIENPVGNSRFDVFLHRLQAIDIVVFHPLILEIMGRKGSNALDRDKFSIALESYLVRRMVCGMQTRGYGSLVLDLLKQVSVLQADEPATPSIVTALSRSDSSAVVWPNDEKFKADWISRKFYNQLRRSRVQMILRAIEEHYQRQNTKSEPIISFNFDHLEVEHVMPQSWDAHWPLPDHVTREQRDWLIHGIGNLTLISESLNKQLSHGPWDAPGDSPSKRKGLGLHSKLELNSRLLNNYPDQWNELAIRERALCLFKAASSIWPRDEGQFIN